MSEVSASEIAAKALLQEAGWWSRDLHGSVADLIRAYRAQRELYEEQRNLANLFARMSNAIHEHARDKVEENKVLREQVARIEDVAKAVVDLADAVTQHMHPGTTECYFYNRESILQAVAGLRKLPDEQPSEEQG